MKRVKAQGESGSFTVEAAMIMPLLILIIFALIFSFTVLYQKALLVRTAANAARQGAEVWTDSRKNIETGAWSINEKGDSLYYQLFSDFNSRITETINTSTADGLKAEIRRFENLAGKGLEERKLAAVAKTACKGLEKGIWKSGSVEMKISFNNLAVQRSIVVKLAQKIKIPLGLTRNFFNGLEFIEVTGEGTAVVAEPAEFIRNTDFCIEYSDRLLNTGDLKGKLKSLIPRFGKSGE